MAQHPRKQRRTEDHVDLHAHKDVQTQSLYSCLPSPVRPLSRSNALLLALWMGSRRVTLVCLKAIIFSASITIASSLSYLNLNLTFSVCTLSKKATAQRIMCVPKLLTCT